MTALLVLLGGAAGAVGRYLADRAVQRHLGSRWPFGTLAVNLAGCLVLGLITGAASGLPAWVASLVGVGFTGALTTYSTFSYEAIALVRERRPVAAVGYLGLSLALGLTLAWLGIGVGRALA